MLHRCTCKAEFEKRSLLIEHIGLLNPKWPRVTPEDEHQVDMEANKKLFTFDYPPRWNER